MADRLAADGWAILDRNWRGGGGEIDLVARLGGRLRFVEVKVRLPDDTLSDDAVSPHKQARLRGAARAWLALHGDAEEQCFLIAYVDATASPWAVRWLDDAFDG